ncbi:membrane protein [Intrasporangium oryzae NRRL B-24470]|uniref:Membrane protein n=1 Tax=Intrasporangium oryzae NRRL B-24470 TaxID=1386089 RepID=W9G1D2_9MICO|nr:hypothetical protein [Intrasporangium oryzae]EWS99754.1 membrane protein [Intrasporangium oryzae NRRL B-24470]
MSATTSPSPADTTASPAPGAPGAPARTAVRRHRTVGPVGVIALLAVLLGLVLTAFALPAVKSAPHDVPIGVAGPAQAAAQVEQALAAKAPGAFAVTGFGDEAALTSAIRSRDVYGGIVVSATGPQVLTAPAGSPAVAQLLVALASGLSAELGRQVPVREIVSPPPSDPRGAGLAVALLPLIIGAVAPVLALTRVVRGAWRQLAAVVSAAVVIGAVLAALLHWYGAFDGSWVRDAAAMSAVLAAMSTALLGLYSIGGLPALGAGVAVFLLVGNPLSGLTTAPEFLPAFWSTLGSWLPPGAGGQLLRSSAYFGGAGVGHAMVVLACWFAFGVALLAVGSRGQRAAEPLPA